LSNIKVIFIFVKKRFKIYTMYRIFIRRCFMKRILFSIITVFITTWLISSVNASPSQRERLYTCKVIQSILDECARTPIGISCSQVSDYVYNEFIKKGFSYDVASQMSDLCYDVCNKPASWIIIRKKAFIQCVYGN